MQFLPRYRYQIRLPPAARIFTEKPAELPIFGTKNIAYVVTDLKRRLQNRWSDPGHKSGIVMRQSLIRRFYHAVGQTAPARMHGANPRAFRVGKQNRHTIGSHDDADLIRRKTDNSICPRHPSTCLGRHNGATVHLFQPYRLGRQGQYVFKPGTVGGHGGWVVTDVQSKIKTIVWRQTDAASTCRG
jgi:hypothetical protein